jgi:hypothetical protein
MPVSVSSTTQWTISNGDQQWLVPASLVKLAGGKPFLVLKATQYKLIRLIAADQLDKIATHSTLSGNKGLQKLIELRNVASGFVPSVPDYTSKLMAEEEVQEKAAKKAKWSWVSGSHQQPEEHNDDPEVVSFKCLNSLDGFDGQVTAIKAYHAKQQLQVAMDPDVLNIVFNLIIDSGLDLTPKKKEK